MIAILVFFILHWYLSLFCQSFFLHRYAAHKMFTMSRFWERFFFFLTYVSQGSSFLSPRGYAILHRMHHAYSDTEKDPHSPHYSTNVFSMMWKTKTIYSNYVNRRVEPEKQFNRNFPEWPALERLGDTWSSRIGWVAFYIGIYVTAVLALDAPLWIFLLLPMHFMMGPLHGAIVNWSGHKYGYRNFDSTDKSRNTFVWDIFLFGELFQNNHHHRPNQPNFAMKWYEIDPTYPIIKLLNAMHVIRLRREA